MKILPATRTAAYIREKFKLFFFLLPLIFLNSSCSQPHPKWYKGNMHTHSFWSDGDEFPEQVARWYRDNGYEFLALTEGNTILEGEQWRNFPENSVRLQNYIDTFGEKWIEMRLHPEEEGTVQVRLKTFNEFRPMFEEPGRFLLIMGNEISNAGDVHLLAFHQDRIIPALEGKPEDRENMIRETVQNVNAYRKETGRNVHAVLTHPNYNWAVTAEMILNVPELRFFEVYNGHPSVKNDGDENRASTDRIWDIVLAKRLSSGEGMLLYGLANDDAHNYDGGRSGPGRGWIMVRAYELTPEAIFNAIDKGEFYASTGVTLKNIQFNGTTLNIEIEPQEGVEYTTEFIGTLKKTDLTGSPTINSDGNILENTTLTYSHEIGQVLSFGNSLNPKYTFTGDELYVRAIITSTADHTDPNSGQLFGKQKAWIQPFIQKRK